MGAQGNQEKDALPCDSEQVDVPLPERNPPTPSWLRVKRDLDSCRLSPSDRYREALITVCLLALLSVGISVCVVVGLIVIGRMPLLEPDVRLLAWDQVWKANLGGMEADAALGWEPQQEFSRISLSRLGKSSFEGPPKIAFLFLTRGPLPLAPVWERFFSGHEELLSVYVHASTEGYNVSAHLNASSAFFGRQVPVVQVTWGGLGMVRAERELISTALEDPANQRFVLLSESCIPIRSFDFVREYLFSTHKSFVTSHVTDWRYPGRKMAYMIPRAKFRKGSQWVALNRKHAEMLHVDHRYFASFEEAAARIPDESYIQTLIPMLDPGGIEPRSVSYVEWPTIFSPHPTTFPERRVTEELIHSIQRRKLPVEETVNSFWGLSQSNPCQINGETAPCFLFARKFTKEAVPKLMELQEHLGY